ncbi:competence protein ComK [Clostridium formicaceticum]|uniref:ComK protein n=1 Tax=Clostridium formicaceticum TaxID=1497 RepID=A0AAC9WFG5_9CLOT|nr:competence protein ComK [Clostridium formicaceticum]AOY75549.1 hypothetical protein BJL90_06350 [Clostridium formicaceticum]ARE85845.1 ComK protein [Clostridium formicaceticum]
MDRIEKILKDKEEIAALVPLYQQDLGNITKVMLQDEEVLLKHSITSVLYAICNYYALHLRLLRKKQQKLLNCKYYVPLPLSKNLLLFPIKTRIPKVKNDSSLAYVNYFQVKKLDLSKKALHLKNGKLIYCLNSAPILKKRYHQATLIAQLQEEYLPIKNVEATLKDLALLRDLLTDLITSFSSSG